MTAPQEITHASRQYEAYADALIARSMLQTHNQVYAMTRAVLHETRDHLTLAQGIRFANGLPAVLRAAMVADWDVDARPRDFPGGDAFLADVIRRLSPHHVPPETIVGDVIETISAHADPFAFKQGLAALPDGLAALWRCQMASKLY